MPRPSLVEAIAQHPLLCDGAMGTQLIARGMRSGECGERWNLTRPDDISEIHQQYLRAGCDLVTTNTFGGTASTLARHGLSDQVHAVNLAGARLGRAAAGDHHWVLGDIGPFGDFLEPMGEMTADALLAIFVEQAKALAEGGVDAFIIETMSDPSEMEVAIRAAKSVASLPVVSTYAFGHGPGDGFATMMGTSVKDALGRARAAGADVVGANCGTSMSLDDYERLAAELVQAGGGAPVILQPNAGSPTMTDAGLKYGATAEDMGKVVPELLDAGIRIVGGCCGTTPAHLATMAQAMRQKIAAG